MKEFLALMSATTGKDKELRDAFKEFDKDGNGFITPDELRSVMKSMGEKLSDTELAEMIKKADKSGDGKVDYEGRNCWFLFVSNDGSLSCSHVQSLSR